MGLNDRIWATFCNMKYKGFLLELLVSKYQKLDRNVNIFLAIASSGSIAVWAVWQQYPLIWSSIIALSQIITVIKPYFPYSKITKELNSRYNKIDLLNVEFEKFWSKIQRGKLKEDMIEQLYFDHTRTYAELLKFPDDIIFDTSKGIEMQGNQKMNNYLKTHFGLALPSQ